MLHFGGLIESFKVYPHVAIWPNSCTTTCPRQIYNSWDPKSFEPHGPRITRTLELQQHIGTLSSEFVTRDPGISEPWKLGTAPVQAQWNLKKHFSWYLSVKQLPSPCSLQWRASRLAFRFFFDALPLLQAEAGEFLHQKLVQPSDRCSFPNHMV